MLTLRRARECLGVCLHACWSLLVPGTGSRGETRCGEKLVDGAVVGDIFSRYVLVSAVSAAKISSSIDFTKN